MSSIIMSAFVFFKERWINCLRFPISSNCSTNVSQYVLHTAVVIVALSYDPITQSGGKGGVVFLAVVVG